MKYGYNKIAKNATYLIPMASVLGIKDRVERRPSLSFRQKKGWILRKVQLLHVAVAHTCNTLNYPSKIPAATERSGNQGIHLI